MTVAKLLTPPTNYAVVQLPERHYPGVVFQGDSLHVLIVDLETAAAETDPLEKAAALADVIERLQDIRNHYEATLDRAGISHPYFRRRDGSQTSDLKPMG